MQKLSTANSESTDSPRQQSTVPVTSRAMSSGTTRTSMSWTSFLGLSLVGILPSLIIGGAAFWAGRQALTKSEQVLEARELTADWKAFRQQQEQTFLYLLLGALTVAGISGGLAIALFRRFNRRIGNIAAQTSNQRSAQATRITADFSQQLHGKGRQRDILSFGVEETRRLLEVHRVVVIGLDGETSGRVIAESVQPGYPRALDRKVSDPCFAARYTPQNPDQVKVIRDLDQAGLPPCYLNLLKPLKAQASLTVPIRYQERFGLLVAHHCDRPRNWSSSEVELFGYLAAQMGRALDHGALLKQTKSLALQLQEEAQWKSFMMDATQYIHESATFEDVLDAAVEEVRRVLESDRVLVYSVDRKTQGVIIAESVARGFPRVLGRTITDPCFEERYIQAYADGRVRALNDIYNAGMTDCYIEQLAKIAVKANLVGPIIHEGKLLGLLVAHQCSGPRQWRDLEIRWFTQMAAQVGYALDNAKLISRVEQMSQESSQMMQAQQFAAVEQLQVQQRLQTSQVALSDILERIGLQVQNLTETAHGLESISTSTSLLRGASKTIEQQLNQMNKLMQRESATVYDGLSCMDELEEQLSRVTVNSATLDQISNTLDQELKAISDLCGQMNQQAIHATIQAGRSSKGRTDDLISAATKQVLSLAQEIQKVTGVLLPLSRQLSTISATTRSSSSQGTEKLTNGKALVQDTQQRLNQIQGMETQLEQLIHQFDHNTLQQQSQLTTLTQSLQVALLSAEQTLQQLEQVNAWLPLDRQAPPQALNPEV